jgi:NAD/NADP transhydrogenase alpha subunit
MDRLPDIDIMFAYLRALILLLVVITVLVSFINGSEIPEWLTNLFIAVVTFFIGERVNIIERNR